MSAIRESAGVPAKELPAAGFVRRQPVVSGIHLQRGDVTVTTMDAAAARRWNPRMALAILVAFTGIGLAGCETAGSMFGGSLFGSSSTPAPEIAAPSPVHRSRRSPRSRWRPSSARPMRSPNRSSRNSPARSRSSACPWSPARTSAPTTRCAATSSRPRTSRRPRCPTSGTSPIRPASG